MPIQVQPDGRFVRTSKSKAKSGHHSHDSREQKMADLKNKVRELEEQKEELINQCHDINDRREQAVDESKALKVRALKWKQQLEQTDDKYEYLKTQYGDLKKQYGGLEKQYGDLEKRSERKSEDIKERDKIIRQRDKQLEELRDDKKFQNGVIKKLEDQDALLRERTTTLIEEKRLLMQEISLRRANDEKQLAENKKLKDENTRLLDWIKRERQLALDKERRDAESRTQRRRYEEDFLDDSRFTRPMPTRSRNRWDSD